MELHPECEQDELMKALTEVQSLAAEQLTTLSSHSIACVNVLHECQLLLESVCLRLMLERQSQIGVVDPRISGLHEADFVPCEARGPPAARSPSAKESLPPTSVWALARGRDGNKSCAAQTFLEDFFALGSAHEIPDAVVARSRALVVHVDRSRGKAGRDRPPVIRCRPASGG